MRPKMLQFYTTYSYPEIWDEIERVFSERTIPEGWELREKDDHKKKRLAQEVKQCETNIQVYKRYLSEEEEKLKTKKKELKDLD